MGRITIRVPDELLDRIDEDRDEETGRSQWFRKAARSELRRDDRDVLRDEIDELHERLETVESHINRPFWKRLLDRDDMEPITRENTSVTVEKREMTDEEIEEAKRRTE